MEFAVQLLGIGHLVARLLAYLQRADTMLAAIDPCSLTDALLACRLDCSIH